MAKAEKSQVIKRLTEQSPEKCVDDGGEAAFLECGNRGDVKRVRGATL